MLKYTAKMTVILLLAVLACASAAPYYNHQQSHQIFYQHHHNQQAYYQHHHKQQEYYQHHKNQQVYNQQHDHQHSYQPHYPVFDSHDDWNSNWKELKKEITGHPGKIPCEGEIENNMYKIVIFLPGFKQNEITVKVKTGLLVIQADHKSEWEPMKSYLDFRILPEFVDGYGVWTYEHCLLTIVLPLVGKSEEEPVTTEVSVTTNQPEYSTEVATTETDQNVTHAEDSDDEIVRGDQGEENIITPAEVSPGTKPVETTTYAIPRAIEY
ncbi:myb-like protein I [Melitaea cinxia]|uniref:myb-like protein I n=1 Tax=Melitaea cinxia TaxID=113334 RepID=UPI001E273D09|nr:myb-like protein I [Melitaea cinxia]